MSEQKSEAVEVVNYKEESESLKESKKNVKETSKKKKSKKKIALENIDLGTKPINIISSKFDFLNYYNLTPSMKIRIKMISILAVVVIFFVVLLGLKGKFSTYNNYETKDKNNLGANPNFPLNQNKNATFSENNKISSSKNGGLQ